MRKLGAALPLFALVVSVAACTGGDEAGVEKGDLPRLVLQPADVPDAFVQFDEGPLVRADLSDADRADPTRFGRQGGWKARFKRRGTPETRGPLVVESRADVFADVEGAKDDFAAIELEAGRGQTKVRAPKIGDESVATAIFQRGSPSVAFFTIGWRYENVTASISVNGFATRTTIADAVALARKQQRRIAARR